MGDQSSRKEVYDAVRETLARNMTALGDNVREGDVIGNIERLCVFDCKRCAFSVFNMQTKATTFTPSHVCPGHAKTKVNCCGTGNFQGWRDREIPEKNILYHLFGIKNGHDVPMCDEISEAAFSSEDEIQLHFRDDTVCRVFLHRISNENLRSLIFDRFSRSPILKKINNTLRTPSPARGILNLTLPPNDETKAVMLKPKRLRFAPIGSPGASGSQLVAISGYSDVGRNEPGPDQPQPALYDTNRVSTNMKPPSAFPFYDAWVKNQQDIDDAKTRLAAAEEMKDMLDAALHVFQRKAKRC